MTVPTEHRLVSYGTLAPGRPNAHQLDALTGTWAKGVVRGHLLQAGWGIHYGYPGMVPDPEGPEVEVYVFTSADLPAHWARLDAFEGEAYLRQPVDVEMDGGVVQACIYRLLEEEPAPTDE